MTKTAHPVSDGIWREVRSRKAPGRPALFLDRDGVLVEEVHYLHRVEDARLVPGAAAVVAAANARDIAVVVVTNQAGIGRGYYGWDEFAAVQWRIMDELGRAGARLDMVLATPFHEEAIAPYRVADHPTRKPNPGMLLAARDDLGVDLARSWIVGDRASDIEAGKRAGLAGGVHVLTGYGPRERASARALAGPRYALHCVESLADALTLPPLVD
ncbi:MAG: HAD-IIIA family hydrolase [Alphaproteobacteria bacterium]|nr:HAD-IIIA family hydrolase [Alphaproteobacteria bacterium]